MAAMAAAATHEEQQQQGEARRGSWLQRLRLRLRRRTPADDAEHDAEDGSDPPFQNAFTRRAIVAALWTGIVLAVPLWWQTTTILRLPLPEAELASWTERGACPIRIPLHLRLHLPDDALPSIYPHLDEAASPSMLFHSKEDLLDHLRQQLVRDLDEASGRTAPGESSAAAQDDSCIDWRLSFPEGDASVQPDPPRFGYDVFLSGSPQPPRSPNVIRLNHPLAPTDSPSASASSIASALRPLFRLPLRSLPLTDTRAIQYSRPLRLVFSLLNEDAARGGAVGGWELEHALRDSELQELVESLGGVHDVVVESQVLWYAPLAFQPTREETVHVLGQSGGCAPASVEEDTAADAQDAAEVDDILSHFTTKKSQAAPARLPCVNKTRTETQWLVEWEDLKVFVNAAAWSLTSAVSSLRPVAAVPLLAGQELSASSIPTLVEEEEKTLHLLLYIPAADQRPLLVRDPSTGNASQAHAWMVPQWGGVVLLNQPVETDAAGNPLLPRKGEVGPALQADDLREPVRLWTDQLRTLLGLRAEQASAPLCTSFEEQGTCIPPRLPSDLLALRRIVESTRDAVATLQSTVRLVHKISNLGVGKEVRGDVQGALELLSQLDARLSSSVNESAPIASSPPHRPSSQAHAELQQALALASLASTLASRAFFHPNMLGLLYFPEEHKYAVYTPLFGPVAVPLLVALLRELKLWRNARRRAKEEKGKTE
ncbi:hypothetical protein OC834_003171 [Tilletia horrida]|nr:hypothetical protein OC834_003171 [Tilletia horrida]